MKKEKDLFGNIIERKATYWIFHDESIPSKRWFIIGLLFVKEEDLIDIVFVSDAKFRMNRREEGWIDNFEEYIPYRAQLDSYLNRLEGKKYPEVKIERLEIENSSRNILLQFCDILLGATQMAIVAGSTKETKRKLGKMIVKWYKDLFLPPWEQTFNLHRKFHLWAFPDKNGAPYTNIDLALKINDGQLNLLF